MVTIHPWAGDGSKSKGLSAAYSADSFAWKKTIAVQDIGKIGLFGSELYRYQILNGSVFHIFVNFHSMKGWVK